MTKTEAIKQSIKHWETMIEWAGKEDKDASAMPGKMRRGIGQDWYGDDCSLCEQYYDDSNDNPCSVCPLAKRYAPCGDAKTLWRKVDDSKTWGEWTKNANAFLKQLRTLLVKEG